MKRISLSHFSTDSLNCQQEAQREGGAHGCGCICSFICTCTCSITWQVTDSDFLENGSLFQIQEEDSTTVHGPLPPGPYE